MKTIFIDWDHTLFDTDKLKNAVMEELEKAGVPKKIFEATYNKLVGYSWKKLYRPVEHLKILQKYVKFSMKDGEKAWATALKKSRRYLFEDAVMFLKILKRRKFRLVLLTFGYKKLQKEKIQYAGIKKYFEKIIFTEKTKPEIIGKFFKKYSKFGEVIFINDNIEETAIIKKHFPNLQIIIKKVKGKRQPLAPKDFLLFNNLKQIANSLNLINL